MTHDILAATQFIDDAAIQIVAAAVHADGGLHGKTQYKTIAREAYLLAMTLAEEREKLHTAIEKMDDV